jgi:hypothetical protein
LALSAVAAMAANNVVEYMYDPAGNITQIKRHVVPGFAITSFDPGSGPVGTTVTIFGVGFSSTPGNNTVKFNGTVATVTASDSGSIGTTVPSGATTGRITVTVAGNTATSGQDFVVTIPGAPAITSFTPSSGAAGTSVSVSGANFQTGTLSLALNGVSASPTISSATALSFSVPANAASGRIVATNASGSGTSAQDFIVPPSGVASADVVSVARITLSGPSSRIGVFAPAKHALVLFDGSANGFYTVQFAQLAIDPTTSWVEYKVIKPDNTVLITGRIGTSLYRPTIHLPKLSAAGTYSVLLSPGTATLSANVRVLADPVLTVDGAPAASSLDFAYQSTRLLFDATAAQRIGVGVMGLTLTPTSATATPFKVYLPDGTLLSGSSTWPSCSPATGSNPQANCDGELVTTVAGTYAIIAEPAWGAYANFSAQLNGQATGSLAADVSQEVALARVGQDSRHTFTASAGDSVGVNVAGIAALPQAQTFLAFVYKPDGVALTSCSAMPPNGAYCELGSLGTTGTYAVGVDPAFGAYGTFKLTLKQGPLLATNDPPTSFSLAIVSEAARFRFSGAAGQNLSVGVSGLTYTGSSGSATLLYVYKPDGSQLGTAISCYPAVASGSCKATLTNLPVTGVYSVALVPPGDIKIAGNINLSADIVGTLTAGTPQSIDAARAGRNARFTFAGATGDNVAVKLYGVTTAPTNQSVKVTIYKPDGAYLTNATTGSGTSAVAQHFSLPTTGTYTVLVEPLYGITWQAQLMLDAGTTLAIDGATATLATTVAGEPLRYRFSGTSGQRMEFGLAGLAYAAASSVGTAYGLYRPDGTSISSLTCLTAGAGACETLVASLPSTGTYIALFTPPATSSVTAGTIAFSTAATGTVVVGDPAQSIAVARPGQTARYTFSGTSAQLLRVNWSSTAVSSGATVTVTVLKPDGSTLSSGSFTNGATSGLDIASLPTTGTYTVVLDPSMAATFSASVTLVTR